MVSVKEAKKIIKDNTTALAPKKISLPAAAGLVLAEDIFALTTIPGFPQSSMDGYAFSFNEWQLNKKLKITGVIAAGSSESNILQPGNAVRIFTGAAVPPGADTVVMQEKTKVENGELFIEDDKLERGVHVRAAGAEIKTGELALSKNILITPAAIGFLTAIGITEVSVFPTPSISIIVTGDELQEPGKPLQHGQVYEANSYTLVAALNQLHITDIKVHTAEDNLDKLTGVLQQALQESDVVFLTGGISVGDFDFVLQATINNGVQQLFHKVKQRPAKPLYFGKRESKYVFGLPGNPASGLTSFYEYAAPALGIMSKKNYYLQTLMVPLEKEFKKPAGLTHFLKGYYNGQTIAVLDGQESYRLSSFAKANCLIQVNEEITVCAAGEMIEIHLLPA
ncbi:MAG: gephyrin-like molybdotransferase Glp [Bacteroidota bacterium]